MEHTPHISLVHDFTEESVSQLLDSASDVNELEHQQLSQGLQFIRTFLSCSLGYGSMGTWEYDRTYLGLHLLYELIKEFVSNLLHTNWG